MSEINPGSQEETHYRKFRAAMERQPHDALGARRLFHQNPDNYWRWRAERAERRLNRTARVLAVVGHMALALLIALAFAGAYIATRLLAVK